jgi:hypothetical protein
MADAATTLTDLAEEDRYGEPTVAGNSKKKGKRKHYPRTEFTTEQMPSLKGYTVGDRIRMTFEAEICEVSNGEDYFEDANKTRTRVRVKFLEGGAEKSSAKVADQEEGDTAGDASSGGTNKDAAAPVTAADKTKKKVADFNKLISE